MANPNPNMSGLRPAKPGEVRNPNGSSRKQRLTNALLKMFEEKALDDPFIKAGIQEALKGDFNFWRHIFERIDGKIPDQVNLGSDQVSQIVGDFLHGKTEKTGKKRQARKSRKRVSGEGGPPPSVPGTP